MDIAKPVGTEITSVDFGFLTTDEIKHLSSKQITNPQVFDSLGNPTPGGLYDLALGAFLKNLCATCGLDDRSCPGHLGHIELPVPVYNPLFFSHMYVLLRATCVHCHSFRLDRAECHKYMCKLRLLQYGLVLEAEQLDNIRSESEDAEAADEAEEGEEESYVTRGPAGSASDSADSLESRRESFVDIAIATAIQEGRTSEAGSFSSVLNDERKKLIHSLYRALISRPRCANCGLYSPGFRNDGYSKLFLVPLKDKQVAHNRAKGAISAASSGNSATSATPSIFQTATSAKYVISSEVRSLLRLVFAHHEPLLRYVFHSRPRATVSVSPDMFFLSCVVVPATRFRLPSKLGDEVHENFQNELLAKILTTCLRIRDVNDAIAASASATDTAKPPVAQQAAAFNQLMNAFVTLQNDVNAFLDSTKSQAPAGKLPLPGIKQALEKKEGLFRKHMMGKRVNYAARSVISPDPNIATNEVGVPPVFAVKLTYPEPVTTHNVAELRQAVCNGPATWPGATHVQREDGSLVALAGLSAEQRAALASQLLTPAAGAPPGVPKKVLRHIRNHDVVLMNRQPTLHKASMMGHRVRVLPGEKTLRLHYANTGAYNADFDGDEMNLHLPQNEAARAEAMMLAATDSQYLTPTSGKPLRGLIQDHISAGVWLTNLDSFFSREAYQQLVYASLRPEDGHTAAGRLRTLPPAIIRPKPLWTGKQVVSTVLLNLQPRDRPGLFLVAQNKVKNEYWASWAAENTVRVHAGQLVQGVLDKSQYGAAEFGLVHAVHEVYGPATAGQLLSALGRLFTACMLRSGFTCGMDDLRLTAEGNAARKKALAKADTAGGAAAAEVVGLPDTTNSAELRRRLEEVLRDDGKLAILDAVAQSKVNAVASEVVAQCVPAGTLKKFPHNAMQLMALSGAKGSNVNVSQIMCLLGQQALEGRRVPVMVSGKTLPSFRPLETHARAGGFIRGRFYSGIRPQEYFFHCMAGREGLIDTAVKTSRSGYLQRCLIKQLEGVHVGYDATVRDDDGLLVQFLYGGDAVDVTKESYLREFGFCADNYGALLAKHHPERVDGLDMEAAPRYGKQVKKALKAKPRRSESGNAEPSGKAESKSGSAIDLPDPVLSRFNPGKYLGAVSERFHGELETFLKSHSERFSRHGLSEKKFKALMQLKYQQSLVAPGEAVGIIAAQSIGEPSTQMTLNTFHFAGHGAANVTLGIPRMREIIMTASAAIKTPQMTLPLLPDVSDEQADSFCKSVARVVLSELLDKVTVVESSGVSADGTAARNYSVRLDFFTRAEYSAEYDVSPGELEQVVTGQLLQRLEKELSGRLRKQKKANAELMAVGRAERKIESAAARTAGRDGEDGDEDRGKQQGKQAVSYDEPDEEELEAMKAAEASSESDVGSDSDDSESDSDSDSDTDNSSKSEEAESKKHTSEAAKARETAVIGAHNFVTKFRFDDSDGEWCEFELELPAESQKMLMVNILEQLCRAVIVREVPGIGRCIRPSAQQGKRVLVTEGVNFEAMWDQDDFIDVNGIRSNDIAAVLRTYGVEAARNTIVNEINNVFSTYAIAVNRRHLDLIADLMTREGSYLAFNRQGIDSSTSPFKKMSYETTCQFLTKTVLNGDRDDLASPSSKIVVGNLAGVGTGCFDVYTGLPRGRL